jgi:hypothetical protein
MEEEVGFTLVCSRRKNRRPEHVPFRLHVEAPVEAPAAVSHQESKEASERVIEQVASARAHIQRFGHGVLAVLTESLRVFLSDLRCDSAEAIPVASIGIGSLVKSNNARFQLAALLEVMDVLKMDSSIPPLRCAHFEPLFGVADCLALESLGHRSVRGVWSREANTAIFYMVHCNAELYDAVLAAHWGPELRTRCIVGNSLSWYAEQRGAEACRSAVRALSVPVAAGHSAPVCPPASASLGAHTQTSQVHVDAAAASVLLVSETAELCPDAASRRSSGPHKGAVGSAWPLEVREHPLGVVARDRDREYQPVYMAFDATSVHTFAWSGDPLECTAEAASTLAPSCP